MTLVILVFNFYPVTAVMIVMIALLNDGAILSIAYDNVRYRNQPEAWNMRVVLGVSTVLGVIGTVAAFGLFYLGLNIFHLDHAHVQTLMYLKLSVAGHLTIFLTRTRGPFWSIRPAKILWIAVLGTQAIATLIAVYGLFMAPLGWRYAGIVWGYALVWFLLNDRIKLLTYWILDRSKSQSKTNVKAVDKKSESKVPGVAAKETEIAATAKVEETPDVKATPASDAKTEAKPDAKVAQTPDANAQTKPKAEAAPVPEATAEVKPNAMAAPASTVKAESEPEAKSAQVKAKAEAGPDTKAVPVPEGKADTKPDAKSNTPTDLTPKLVERVHALYEELGRQDVLAVQALEEAEKASKKEAVP
jgi:H+-transporting ATPase